MKTTPYVTAHSKWTGLDNVSYAVIDDELLEAVDVLEDGTPDWESASICDEILGDDPELQRALRVVLQRLKVADDSVCADDNRMTR